MASNSIAKYLGNLGKSVKYAAIETLQEQMPVTTNFIVTNKDTVRETYKSIVDSKHVFNKLGTIEDNSIFKNVSKAFGNIKTDVMSGNFYHPERTDPMAQLGALGTLMEGLGGMGGEFEELANLFSEDQEQNPDYAQKPEYLITKGDALIASSLIKVNSTSTNCMGRLITKLHDNKMKTTRAIADMQMVQGQKSMILQQTGFNSMAQGFNSLIGFNNEIMRTHVENSRMFYENMTHLTRDNNAILHALHDMQASVYRSQSNGTRASEAPFNIDAIFHNGFDLKAYKSMLKSKITKSPLAMVYNAISILPMMMEDMIANPLHFLTKQAMKGFIGPQLGVAMDRFDKTLQGAFSTGLAKLYDYGEKNSKSLLGKIAKTFGLKQKDAKLSTGDASKFNRGAMSWNGIAQKSRIEVIPGHLRRIEAYLTGQGERVMDYQTGKWSSAKSLKNFEKHIDNELARQSTSDVSKQLQAVLNSLKYNSDSDRKQMKNAGSQVMKGIYDKGYVDFEDINKNAKGRYGEDGLVQIIAGVLRNILPTHKAAALTTNIAKAKQAKGSLINSTSLEDTSLANELINNSTFGEIGKRGNKLSQLTSPAAKLLEVSDKHGHTIYDYQYLILSELQKMNAGTPSANFANSSDSTFINPNDNQNGIILPQGFSGSPSGAGGKSTRFTRNAEDKKRTHERADAFVQSRNFKRFGLVRNEAAPAVDLNELLSDPNSKASKNMIQAIVQSAKASNDISYQTEYDDQSNIFSSLLRSSDHKNDADKLPKGIDPKSNVVDQLIQAADMGQKFDVIRFNLNKLVQSPATLMTGIIGKADEAVYNVLFGKEVGEKDKNGNPVNGIFGKMSAEVDKSMDSLNETINGLGKKIKSMFDGDFWGSVKKGMTKYLGIDVDSMIEEGRDNYIKPLVHSAAKSAKKTAKDIGGDIRNSIAGTMKDMGILNDKGKLNFNTDDLQQHANGTKKVQSGGLTFISPGEAIIPANMNPWNPDRDKVNVKSQALNENRMKDAFVSKYKNHFAKLGDSIPTNATGNKNTAVDLILQRLNDSEVDDVDINNMIKAGNKVALKAAKDKAIANSDNSKDTVASINKLYKILTDKKFASTATKMRLKGVTRNKLNNLVLDKASDENLSRITNIDSIGEHSYGYIDKVRKTLDSHGYKGKLASDEEIGQHKLNNRQGPITGVRQAALQATGTDPVKAVEMAKDFTVKNAASLGKGGAIGALLSAVFPLGGPLLGSLIGAGVTTLSKSESFQKYMFGEVVDDGNGKSHKEGGLISQKVVDIYNKYIPDAKKYGITGAIAGLVTPFGPLGGAMIGAGASLLKNNQTLNNFLFGDKKGLLNKNRKEAIKRAFPHMGAAMLGTFFLGPFGLLGNAVLGAGIGLVSTTESFKRIMLGSKGRDGVRRGGIAGAIRRQITEPFKRTMEDMRSQLGTWFKDKIFEPVSRGLSPIGKLAGGIIKHGMNSMFNRIGKKIRGSFIGNLTDKALRKVRQAGGVGKWVTKKFIGGAAEKAASAVESLGGQAAKFAVKHGYGDMYSAEERANIYKANGIRNSNSAADNTMKNMDYHQVGKNAKLLDLVNAHMNGNFANRIANQKQDELDYFENAMMKLEKGQDTATVDSLSGLRKKLYSQLKEGKLSAADVPALIEEINNTKGLSGKLKSQIMEVHKDSLGRINEISGREKAAKGNKFLKGSLEEIKREFKLGNISDDELKKMIPSLARNLSNEVDVRQSRRDALAEEEKKKKEANGEEDDSLNSKANKLQEEANDYSSQMLGQLKEINKTLLGLYNPNSAKTKRFDTMDHRLLRDQLDYRKEQSDFMTQAYQDKSDEMNKNRAEKLMGLRHQMGANKGGSVENLSDENISKLGMGQDKILSSNMKKISEYLAGFEKEEINHNAKIKNADKLIELSDKYGVEKSAERIVTLGMYGYTVEESDYETISRWSNTAYETVKQLAKLGAKFDNFKLFNKIKDDAQGKILGQDIVALAAVQSKGDKSKILASVMTVSDLDMKLRTNRAFKDNANNGKSMQEIYNNTQDNAADDSSLHKESSADKMSFSTSRNENFNTTYNADDAIKEATMDKLGEKFVKVAESILDHYFKKYKEEAMGTMDDAADYYDKVKGNEIGESRVSVRSHISSLAPYANKHKEIKKRYDSTSGLMLDNWSNDDANGHLSFNKFQSFKDKKKLKVLSKMSDDDLDNLVHETPDESKDYVTSLIAQAKGQSVGQHAFGLKAFGATAATAGAGLLGAGKEAVSKGGSTMIGSLFGLNGDGSEKKSEDSDNEVVQQTPKAQLSSGVDSNAISAIANATNPASGAGGQMTPQKDKDGGTFTVPTAEGDFIRYGKSKVDGTPMKIKDKNNMEVEAKVKRKNALQERSTAALENIAKKIGASGPAQAVKKKAKGLLDLLKDLKDFPKTILDNIFPGLGTALYAGLSAGGGILGTKALGALTNKFGVIKNLRTKLGGRIAKGGLLGGILNKTLGGFALNAEEGAAGAAEKAATNAAEKTAAKGGTGLLSKVLPHMGKFGKGMAGLLAAYGGYKMLSPETAEASKNNQILLDENGEPIPAKIQEAKEGPWSWVKNALGLTAVGGAGYAAKHAIEGTKAAQRIENSSAVKKLGSWASKIIPKTKMGKEATGIGLIGGALGLIPRMTDAKSIALSYGKGTINNEVLENAGVKDHKETTLIDRIPAISASIGGAGLAKLIASKLGGGSKSKFLASILGSSFGSSAVTGQTPSLTDLAISGGFGYGWNKVGDILKATKHGATAGEGLISPVGASKGFLKGIGDILPKSKAGQVAALAAGTLGLSSILGSSSGEAAGRNPQIPQMNPNNPNVNPGEVPNGKEPGMINTIGSLLGYLGGSKLGSKLFKGHGILGSIIGGTLGGQLGDSATGGEGPSVGGLVGDLASNAAFSYGSKIVGKGFRKAKGALGFKTAEAAEKAATPGQLSLFGDAAEKAPSTISSYYDKAKSFGGKAINTAGDAINEAKPKAAEMAEKGQEVLTKAKDMMDKILPSIEKWLPGKGAKEVVQKFFAKVLESMAKPQNMAKGLAKLAKQGVAAAAGSASLGIGYAVLTAGFAVADFLRGYNDVEDMLKIKPGSATTGMKVVSGLVTAVCGAVPIVGAFLPEDYILELAIEYVGPYFGFSKQDLEKLRKDGEKEDSDSNQSEDGSNAGSSDEGDPNNPLKGTAGKEDEGSSWMDKVKDFAATAVIPGAGALSYASKFKDMITGEDSSSKLNELNPDAKAANKETPSSVAGNQDAEVKNTLSSVNDKDAQSKIDAQSIIGKVTSGIEEVAQAIQKWLPSETFQSMGSFASGLVDEISKPQNIQNGLSKLSTKASAASSITQGAVSLGVGYMAIKSVNAAGSFVTGMNAGNKLFNLKPGLATPKMKILSGLIVATTSSLPFLGAFIAEDKIVNIAIDTLGPSLGFSKKDIDDLRKAGDEKDKSDKKDSTKAQAMSGFDGSQSDSWTDKLKVTTKGVISNVISGATAMASSLADKAQSLADSAKSGAKSAIDWVKDKAGAVGDWVSDHAHQGAQYLKDKAMDAYNGAKRIGSKVWDTVSSGASSLYNGAKDLAHKGMSMLGLGKHGIYGMGEGQEDYTDIQDPNYTIPDYNKINPSDSIEVKASKHAAQLKGLQASKGSSMPFNSQVESPANKFYSQLDPKYSMDYNASNDSIHQTMKDSGCGPVSASNALSSLGINVDPRVAAQYALSNGYKESDGGTMPGFFKSFMNKAGVDAKDMHNPKDITDSLKQGNPVVLMGKDNRGDNSQNPYAENPHYVTATGMDNSGNIIVQDPESFNPNKKYKPGDVLGKSTVAISANKKGNKVPSYNQVNPSDSNIVKKAKWQAQLKSMISSIMSSGKGKINNFRKFGSGQRFASKYGRGGSDNVETAFNWLTSQDGGGLNNAGASGIIGNLMVESHLDPTICEGGTKHVDSVDQAPSGGYGIAQWTFPARRDELAKWCSNNNLSSGSLEGQLGFIKYECTDGSYKGVWAQMAGESDPEQAASDFMNSYENPAASASHEDDRRSYAKECFDKQGKGVVGASSYKGGSSGGKSATKKDGGLFGALGDVATILRNALMPWAAQAPDGSKSGGDSGSTASGNVKAASDWANSIVNKPENWYGNEGCTAFCLDYLKHANSPVADKFQAKGMYVPGLYKLASSSSDDFGEMKGPDAAGSEGDVAMVRYDNTPESPTHAVIADGKGGYWGNSSGSGVVVHKNSLAGDYNKIYGYLPTGSGDGTVSQGECTRSDEDQHADAGSTDGKGKHLSLFGRGRKVGNTETDPKTSISNAQQMLNKTPYKSDPNFRITSKDDRDSAKEKAFLASMNDFMSKKESSNTISQYGSGKYLFGRGGGTAYGDYSNLGEDSDDSSQGSNTSYEAYTNMGDPETADNHQYGSTAYNDYTDMQAKDNQQDQRTNAASTDQQSSSTPANPTKKTTNNSKSTSSGSKGKWGFLTSMAEKVASPISKMMSTFGSAVAKASGVFMNNPVMKELFGDMNPFLDALGMSSDSGGNKSGGNNSKGGHSDISVEGNVADTMVKAIPGGVIPEGGEYGVPRANHAYGHGGIDVCPSDDSNPPVPSPVDGTVCDIGNEPGGYGNYVQVQDGEGNYHIFGHLQSQSVNKGDSIKAGDYVGIMGSTGHSSGTHVHYEVDGADNAGASANAPHINPHSYAPSAGGSGRHTVSKYGMGKKPPVSYWGTGNAPMEISNTVSGIQAEATSNPSRYANLNEEAEKVGYSIPEYNLINDGDDDTVKQFKLKSQRRAIDQFKKNQTFVKRSAYQTGTGNTDLDNTKTLKEVPRPTGEIFQLPGNFGIDQKMAKQSQYGKGISEYKNISGYNIPSYNTISSKDSLMVQAAKQMAQMKYAVPNVPPKPTNTISAYQNLSNTEGYVIPDYNIINPDDDDTIKESKHKAQLKGFEEYKKNKAKEDAEKQNSNVVGPTPSDATKVSKDSNDGNKYSKLASSVQATSDKAKSIQSQNVTVIDDVAPNGKHYDKNDVDYLLKNGYNKEDAIKLLSKDKKYAKQEMAPNGKPYEENDINYLINKGYTREDAIALLAKDKKYSKDGKTDSTAIANKSNPTTTAATNTNVTGTNTNGQAVPNGDKLDALLASQDKTNQLLASILQVVAGAVGAKVDGDKPKLNTNTGTKETSTTSNIKATLSAAGHGSNVGMGDAFMGNNRDHSSINDIIQAINAVVNR